MNIDAKNPNNILANWIQKHIKRITQHVQVGLSLECKDDLTCANQKMWYTTFTEDKNRMIISTGAGINLTKKVKDLYAENYKTLKRKLNKTQING